MTDILPTNCIFLLICSNWKNFILYNNVCKELFSRIRQKVAKSRYCKVENEKLLLLRWSLGVVLIIILHTIHRCFNIFNFLTFKARLYYTHSYYYVTKFMERASLLCFIAWLQPHNIPSLKTIIQSLCVLGYVSVFDWIWRKDILKCLFFFPLKQLRNNTKSIVRWPNNQKFIPRVQFQTRISRYWQSPLTLVHYILLSVVLCKHAKNTKQQTNHPNPSLCWMCNVIFLFCHKEKPTKRQCISEYTKSVCPDKKILLKKRSLPITPSHTLNTSQNYTFPVKFNITLCKALELHKT